MQKKIKKKFEEHMKFDFSDRKVGIWGILALVLIVFGFILAPLIPGIIGEETISDLNFGYYKNTPINYKKDNKFAHYVSYYFELYSRFGDNSQNINMDYNIWYLAFMKYVEELANLDLAKRYDFYVSKENLNKNLLKHPAYLDLSGKFSVNRYNKISEYQKAKIYSDMVESLIYNDMQVFFSSNFMFPDSALESIKKMSKIGKDISYISMSYKDYSIENVIAYALKQEKLFRHVSVNSIDFDTLTLANEAHVKLKNNTPFGEVAKLGSKDPVNFKIPEAKVQRYFELDLNISKKSDTDSIFSLKEGEYSNPIKLKDSEKYKIFKVVNSTKDFDKNSNEDLNIVRTYIETYEPSIIEKFLESKLDSIALEISSKGLKETLSKNNLELKKEIVNLTYKMNLYKNTLKDLSVFSDSKPFYDLIFSLKENIWSKPFLVNQTVYLFLLNSNLNNLKMIEDSSVYENFKSGNAGLISESLLNKADFKNDFNSVFFKLMNGNDHKPHSR